MSKQDLQDQINDLRATVDRLAAQLNATLADITNMRAAAVKAAKPAAKKGGEANV
ncbi:hypothetical protein [Sphingobium sp. LSP13-1-1.1]|uniref:hypothetical protein n=1 Tax=Sphingobium sp. LSP13-1-1.1 TaxID=3135234 RepID=UPI0034376270